MLNQSLVNYKLNLYRIFIIAPANAIEYKLVSAAGNKRCLRFIPPLQSIQYYTFYYAQFIPTRIHTYTHTHTQI